MARQVSLNEENESWNEGAKPNVVLPNAMVTTTPSFIVGLVGSAGSLGAFKAFVGALPTHLGMAYVIVSHTSPIADSELTAILSRLTKMPTRLASLAMTIQKNHIYVIPSKAYFDVEGFAFKALSPPSRRGNHGDLFFRSLAEAMGARAVGVVLSGYGSDGTEGCGHIKANGGTTFAQDSSAEVGFMTSSAQASGDVDFVLAPERMPGELERLMRNVKKRRIVSQFDDSGSGESLLASATPQQNHLLAALSEDVQHRLFAHLELTPVRLGDVLYESGGTMRHVYFPTTSIIALLHDLENGKSSAISVVGNEGLVGVSLIMGGEHTLGRAVVQNAGFAYRLLGQRIKDELKSHGKMELLFLRYTQALITQMTQTAACNLHHSIDERLSRWLLLSLDRLSTDRLIMTQELIANMLGVRREGVTEAASKLQEAEVIEYNRGKIIVLDRPRLEELSCECYAVIKKETDRLLPYLPGSESSLRR